MESVRYRINSIFDRAVRLHQMEFEVAPEMYRRLRTSYDRTRHLVSFSQQYTDLDKMGAEQLDDFVKNSPLRDWQKVELKLSPKKLDYYINAIFGHELNDTLTIYYKFSKYQSTKGIFLAPEIDAKFAALRDIIFDAIQEKKLFEQMRHIGAHKPGDRPKLHMLNGSEKAVEELRTIVGGLLRDSKAQPANQN